MLPKETVLLNYVTHKKIWQYGQIVKTLALSCPANPLCESIKCYFRREAMFNPQCASAWQILIVICAIYLSVLILHVL